jgi:hypothetical protein
MFVRSLFDGKLGEILAAFHFLDFTDSWGNCNDIHLAGPSLIKVHYNSQYFQQISYSSLVYAIGAFYSPMY